MIVVEGILVLHSARLRRAADLIVYVEVPAAIRLVRSIRRDVAERGRTVESVLDQYLGTVRPMHEQYVASMRSCAQLILSGSVEPLENVRRILAQAPSRVCSVPGSSREE